MKKHSITVLALFILIFTVVFYDEIKQAIIIVAYTLAGLLSIAFVLVLLLAGWYMVEKMRMIRANRIEAEKQAHVMVITNNGQTWIRDTDHKAYWKAGHLEQRVYSNSQYSQPSLIEAMAWQVFNSPKSAKTVELLPEVTTQPIDLLPALDNEQRVLIVGPSNAGKTDLLKWVVTRRINNSQVVIIDPHSYVDKWPSGQVIGIGRNYPEISRTLEALVQLMQKRYQQIGRGEVREGNHKRVCVCVDEWRAITGNLPKAGDALKTLLTESRKASMSMFVASHSDRAKPLGLSGEYDLKSGFVIIRLSIQDGERIATIDVGDRPQPARLPGPYISSQVIEGDDYINLEPEPSPAEAHILHLHSEGTSYNEIARQVYGHTGGKQTAMIKQVIAKFN